MHATRRFLLGGTAAGLLTAALAACTTGPFAKMTPTQIVAQAQAAASGLLGMLQQVAKAYPVLIPPATLATLTKDLTLAVGSAQSLSGNMPATQGATVVKTVEGYLNAVLNTLAAPPINGLIPSPFNMAVAAAAFIVPQLEAFVGTYIPAAAASPATVFNREKFAAQAPGMTTAEALAVLKSYEAR